MSMMMKETVYNAPSKQILAIPDHYVALPFKHEKATSSKMGLTTEVNGRFILKAGTIYPSNDDKAIGVVLNDYDLTDGDQNIAVVVHGFIKKSALPVAPQPTVKLPMIMFVEPLAN